MDYEKLLQIVKDLPVNDTVSIFKEGNEEILIVRPFNKFKKYDEKKNFQIFIKEGERVFRPNHLRVMIDLHLRVRSRPDLKKELLIAFDNIFYKKDSIKAIQKIIPEHFEHSLNSIKVIAILSQLFLIEQEYNYTKPSKYSPVTLFYQGWIRQSIDSSKEIDNLAMSICKSQPPAIKYTKQENKNHKEYNEQSDKLWYLL